MVLSANDKNNGGGYSIEDILEEVRRMRKDQTKRPDNADRLKRNSADHGPALHDTGNINKMPAKDMPQDAGTKLNKPSDSNIGNTHNNVHKSQTDIQRGKSIPEHKSISPAVIFVFPRLSISIFPFSSNMKQETPPK